MADEPGLFRGSLDQSSLALFIALLSPSLKVTKYCFLRYTEFFQFRLQVTGRFQEARDRRAVGKREDGGCGQSSRDQEQTWTEGFRKGSFHDDHLVGLMFRC